MEITLKCENVLEFIKIFPDDESCREFIANEKWKDGYKCQRCKNTKYVYYEKHNKRECTKCRYNESATAGTLFHRVKFGIQKAFCIAFEMTYTNKPLSSILVAQRYEITQKTAWIFIQKVKFAMKASESYPKETIGRNFDSKKTEAVHDFVKTDEVKIKEAMQILLPVILQSQ